MAEFTECGMRSLISDVEEETLHYARLKSGETILQMTHSLESLPLALIETRVASGLTQSDVAEGIGVTVRAVQRLEDSEYQKADLDTLIQVANLLSVPIEGLADADSLRTRESCDAVRLDAILCSRDGGRMVFQVVGGIRPLLTGPPGMLDSARSQMHHAGA